MLILLFGHYVIQNLESLNWTDKILIALFSIGAWIMDLVSKALPDHTDLLATAEIKSLSYNELHKETN
jgi:hypothetical protein